MRGARTGCPGGGQSSLFNEAGNGAVTNPGGGSGKVRLAWRIAVATATSSTASPPADVGHPPSPQPTWGSPSPHVWYALKYGGHEAAYAFDLAAVPSSLPPSASRCSTRGTCQRRPKFRRC